MSSNKNKRYFHKNNCLSDTSSYPSKRFRLNEESEKEKPKNETLQEKIAYFEKILNTLKCDISDDNRELFAFNALEESVGHEVSLSCTSLSSHCIEILLPLCKDSSVWMRFMAAFSKYKEVVCTNASASHITELLLYYAVQNIQNWQSIEEKEDCKEKEQVSIFISWIAEFGDFLCEHFFHFLENQFASHVACSIVKALGGHMTKNSEFKSKKALNHTKEFSSEYVDDSRENFLDQVTLEKIPKDFKEKLKRLSRTIRQTKHISRYVTESYCATVFQALVLVLGKRLPKQFKKFMAEFTAELLSEKHDNGVPHAILHKNCSFLVEKLFQASEEQLQLSLWRDHLSAHAEYLCLHNISHFFIQRLFDAVKEPTLLLLMMEGVVGSFDKILQAEHHGIFISMASACVRLKAHQALFMKSLMECLDCLEPEERQLQLVPLLLCLKKNHQGALQVCLKGSLLTQKLLSFQKPIKLVKSMLNLRAEEISYLACHIQGCHVLTAFFRNSLVGEKNKDKFIHCFQPMLLSMACDRDGSLTLSRIWMLLSIKQKILVAQVLSQSQVKLKENKQGNILFNKFKIFYFMHKNEVWKKMQLEFVQKT